MEFFERLREERKRLKLNQTQFAALAGTTKNSQLNYEKGNVCPSAEYLVAIAEAGVDVQYVLTGRRSGDPVLTPEEKEMLAAWKNAPEAVRAAARAALLAGSETKNSGRRIVGGNVHTEPGGKTVIAENIHSLKM